MKLQTAPNGSGVSCPCAWRGPGPTPPRHAIELFFRRDVVAVIYQAAAITSYLTIANFGWDQVLTQSPCALPHISRSFYESPCVQDDYGKDPNNVYVYITSGMDGVSVCKQRVSCDFRCLRYIWRHKVSAR